MQRSAASFNAAHTSLSESIALITATNSVVQDPDVVGTMWKTVSARIRGASSEIEDMGEDTEGMVTSTSKLRDLVKGITGFDIMADEAGTEFKSIYDIIVGIGEQWDNINDINKAALLEALAGKRQANALAATLQNTEMLKDAYETAENSAGSAAKSQENFTRSIQYSINTFKAIGQETLFDTIGTKGLKGAIDAGSGLVSVLDKILDKTGLLGPALATAMAVFTRRTGTGLLRYDKVQGKMTGFLGTPLATGTAAAREAETNKGRAFLGGVGRGFADRRQAMLQTRGNIKARSALASAVYNTGADELWTKSALTGNYANLDKIYANVAKNLGISADELKRIAPYQSAVGKSGAVWASDLERINQSQRGVTDMLKGGLKSIGGMVGQMAIMMAASWAIEAVMNKISEKTITFDEAIEGTRALMDSYHELRDTTNDNIKTAKSLEGEYFKLRKGVDTTTNQNRTLSTEDYDRFLDINKQLADMFPTMIGGYDAQGNAILNLAQNVTTLTDAYDKARIAAANSLIKGDKEAGTGIETFAQAYMNATTETQGTNSQANRLSRLQGSLKASAHEMRNNWYTENKTPTIEVGIDISNQEAQDAIEHFIQNAKGMKDEFKEFGNIGYQNSQELRTIASFLDVSRNDLMDIIDDSDRLNTAIGELQTKQADLKAETQEMVNAGRDYLTAFLQADSSFYELSENQQNILTAISNNMPQDILTDLFEKGKASGNITGTFDTYMESVQNAIANNTGFTSSISNIQSILADGENLTTTTINTVIDNLDKLDGKIAGLSKAELSEIFGADSAIDTLQRFNVEMDNLTSMTSEVQGELYGFNVSEMEVFLDVVKGKTMDATQALEEYKNAIIVARAEQGEVGEYSFIDAINKGGSFTKATELSGKDAMDHGKTYASMKEMIDSGKELYKQGDYGTEQFKSIAGMFDVAGRTGAKSWTDNVKKLGRYFKDAGDSSVGLVNFLEDLESHDLATYSKDTGEWALQLGDLSEAAREMGIGYEPFLALLDELEAKDFKFEHFETEEDGMQRIGELQAQLVDAQAEYNRLKAEGASDKTLAAQQENIDEIKSRIEIATDALKHFREAAEEGAKGAQASLNTVTDETFKSAMDVRSGKGGESAKYALFNEAKSLQEQLDTMHLKYGLDVDDKAYKEIEDKLKYIDQVLKEIFGEDYKLDLDFNDNLEGIEGKTMGSMDVTADVVNVNGKTNEDTKSANKEGAGKTKTTKEEDTKKATPATQTPRQNLSDRQVLRRGSRLANAGERPDRSVTQRATKTKTLDIQVDSSSADATLESLESRADELIAGKTIMFTADVDGVESTVSAVSDEEGNITFSANVDGVQTTVSAVQKPDGTISYVADTNKVQPQVNPYLSQHGAIDFSVSANLSVKVKEVVKTAAAKVKTALQKVKNNIAGGSNTTDGPKYTGTLNGFAGGTIRSFARGSRVSIDKDQNAIVNELGEFTPRINLFNCGETLRALYTTT